MQATKPHLTSPFQTKTPTPESPAPRKADLFPDVNAVNQAVLYAGKSVCQYIDLKKYYSGTKAGVIPILEHYEEAFMVSEFREKLKEISTENNLDKISKDFLGKAASKVTLCDSTTASKKTIWIGNCGEKADTALFHLLKYYPEHIKAIEMLTVFLSKDPGEFQHAMLVLNRDPSSEAFPDPSCWKPIEPGLEIVIVDPSFNKAFFAKDYMGNLMAQYAKKSVGEEGAVFNQYIAYQANPDLFVLHFGEEILSQKLPLIEEYTKQTDRTHTEKIKSLAVGIRQKIAMQWFLSRDKIERDPIERERIKALYSMIIQDSEKKRAQLDKIFPDDRAYGL